jgi:hypothetical protein
MFSSGGGVLQKIGEEGHFKIMKKVYLLGLLMMASVDCTAINFPFMYSQKKI